MNSLGIALNSALSGHFAAWIVEATTDAPANVVLGAGAGGIAAFLFGYLLGKGRGRELRKDVLETMFPPRDKPGPPESK